MHSTLVVFDKTVVIVSVVPVSVNGSSLRAINRTTISLVQWNKKRPPLLLTSVTAGLAVVVVSYNNTIHTPLGLSSTSGSTPLVPTKSR